MLALATGAALGLPLPLVLQDASLSELAHAARRLSSGVAPPVDLNQCSADLPPGPVLNVAADECFKIDQSATLAYEGIHVLGTLAIDTTKGSEDNPVEITISTQYVFVEGIFAVMTPATDVVPSKTGKVDITLVKPADSAVTGFTFKDHDVGVKAFAVYGGQLRVEALPAEGCPSWTTLQGVIEEPMPAPVSQAEPLPPPTACADETSSFVPLRTSFEDQAGQEDWYADDGTLSFTDTNGAGDGILYAVVTERTQGRYLLKDISTTCVVPNERYRFVAKVRTRGVSGYQSSKCYLGDSAKCVKAKIPGVEYLGSSVVTSDPSDWLLIEDSFQFTTDELNTGFVTLRFYGPAADETIEVDYVRLERAPKEAYPLPSPGTCAELIRNGDMELDEFWHWNWEKNGGGFSMDLVSEAGNQILRSTGRDVSYHGPKQKVEIGCFQPGVTLAVTARVLLPAGAPCTNGDTSKCASVELRTKGGSIGTRYHVVAAQTSWTDGAWNTVSGSFELNSDYHDASLLTEAEFRLRVNDGGAAPVVDWDDVSITFASGAVRTLVLDGSISPCWSPGAQLLITSHTVHWSDAQTVVIATTTAAGDQVHVRLTDTIKRPTTALDSAEFAVEVALLTRNVVIQGAEDSLDGQGIGGHLIVMHTPEPQLVHGIELLRMGQQGLLGRYPAHMHLCHDSSGSVWSSNLIRNSHQRCVVIHGTNNTLIEDNVAFDTRGHCFMLEDGGETGNSFQRNLGATTRRVTTLIRSEETDDDPSTFWITNPDNTWEDNVAAGSESTGYWFEMRTSVREPTREHLDPAYNPKEVPLRLFARNVAHSNNNDGLQTYPGAGYTPKPLPGRLDKVGARFEHLKSYRNRAAGVFFHNSAHLEVTGGLFADNDRGVDVDRAHTCSLNGTTMHGRVRVYGVTELYQNQLITMGLLGSSSRSHCYSPSADPIIGVHVHEQREGTDKRLGTQLVGVHFERFSDEETGCAGGRAIGFDDEKQGYFDARSSVAQLTWSPPDLQAAQRVNMCKEGSDSEPEHDHIALRDTDGTLIGPGAGFVVSDTPLMTNLLMGVCSSIPGACAASCLGVCLRQIEYRVSSLTPSTTVLRITPAGATVPNVDAPAYASFGMEDTPKETLKENTELWDRTKFFVTVPSGIHFQAQFLLDGQPTWPVFVETVPVDEPGACSTGAATDFVDLVTPPVEVSTSCADVVINGDFELPPPAGDALRVEGWWHDGGGVFRSTDVAPNAYAVSDERTRTYHGPAQWLDTRCFGSDAIKVGGSFSLRAKVNLFNTGAQAVPDDDHQPNCFAAGRNDCVEVRLKVYRTDGSSYTTDFAFQTEFVYGAWNLVAGSFEVTEDLIRDVEAVYLRFSGPEAGVVLALDDVELVYVAPKAVTPCPSGTGITYIVDGGFDDYDSYSILSSWESSGATDHLVAVAYAPNAAYARSYAREHTDHGPTQFLQPSCWTSLAGEYSLRADIKLVKPAGGDPNCYVDGSNCPVFELKLEAADGSSDYERDGTLRSLVSSNVERGPDSWDLLSAKITISPTSDVALALNAGQEVTEVRLKIEGPEPGVEVLVDNVHLVKNPDPVCPAKATLGVVPNGKFDDVDGDNLPHGWKGRYGSLVVAEVEAEAVTNMVARSALRESIYDGPLVSLRENCNGVSSGTSLVVHARVKIDNHRSGPAECSEIATSRCIRCTRRSRAADGSWTYRSCGYMITPGVGHWSILEGHFTVEADEADNAGEWDLYFEGPEINNDILVDDVWVGELGHLLQTLLR